MILPVICDEQALAFGKQLNFVQLSDTHYSLTRGDTTYKLLTKSKPLLEDAIKQINERKKINFVILTGDGIDIPEKYDICSLADDLNTLKYPWYFVIGNHDTSSYTDINKKNIIKIINEKNHDYTFNSTYYSFRPKKGFKAIVLDGAVNEGRASSGIIPEEELNWLDDEMKDVKRNETVLIFIHFPILPPYDSKNHEIVNVQDVKNILYKYKMPIAIFSGHYHMTKITKRGNILHVSTPSLIGYPNAFRIVEVENTRKETIFKIELVETGLKELQSKTKIMALGGALYYGRPKDRNAVIVINKRK